MNSFIQLVIFSFVLFLSESEATLVKNYNYNYSCTGQIDSNNACSNAFDNDVGTAWMQSINVTSPQYAVITLSSPMTVTSYQVYMLAEADGYVFGSSGYDYSWQVTSWAFEGSNSGDSYTTLSTVNNYNIKYIKSPGQFVLFNCSSPASYKYYRFLVKANWFMDNGYSDGDTLALIELVLNVIPPTSQPSSQPSSQPTFNPNTPLFSIQATTQMNGVTKATLDISVFVKSLTSTLNSQLGITTKGFQVTVTSIQDVAVKYVNEHRRLTSVSVDWSASVSQSAVVASATSATAVAAVVSSNSFSTLLNSNLNSNGLTGVTATTIGIVVLTPTAFPTPEPTPPFHDNTNNAETIIIAVVVPVGVALLLMCALIYLLIHRYKIRNNLYIKAVSSQSPDNEIVTAAQEADNTDIQLFMDSQTTQQNDNIDSIAHHSDLESERPPHAEHVGR